MPGTENGRYAGSFESRVIFRRNDAPADHLHVPCARGAQRRDELGHEHSVSAGLRRDADDVNVVLDGLPRDLLGRREQRAHVDVEAEIGECRGNDFLTAIVTVLPELGDENARSPSVRLAEGAHGLGEARPIRVVFEVAAVDAAHRASPSFVATEHFGKRLADFADRCAASYRLDRELEQILGRFGALLERGERRVDTP